MKAFALLAAILVVLTGFSVAVMAETAGDRTASIPESIVGGNGPNATDGLGGDATEPPTSVLVALVITAAGDTATLSAVGEIAANSLLTEFTAIAPYPSDDGLGTTSATWTDSIHAGDTVIFEKHDDGSTTKYVYAAGLRVARIDCEPRPPPLNIFCTTAYYLTDHLGSTRKVLDTADPPHVTFSAEYAPFGEAYNVVGQERFRFTGEQHDAPTGFTHLRARQYDPATGRFTGLDPVLGSLAHPQTQNRYAYAMGNPGRFTDPSGEIVPLILLALVLIGVGTAVASHYIPALRPITDFVMTGLGFIPIFGDVLSTAYFLTHDALDCAEGHCDPVAIGLDALGVLPVVPNVGGRVLRALGGFAGVAMVTRRADDLGDLARMGRHSVYTLVDEVGDVRYVGRTTNVAARKAAHLRDQVRGAWTMEVVHSGMTRSQARGLEEILFMKHGEFKLLDNKIRPISFYNPMRSRYLTAGWNFLG